MTFDSGGIASPRTEQGKRFLITLRGDTGGNFVVCSCDIVGPTFANRTSFSGGARLEDVFCRDFGRSLAQYLAGLDPAGTVVDLPDFLLELPGVTISGLRLIATAIPNGGLDVAVRFRTFIGGINRLFHHSVGFDDPVIDRSSELALQVISDIAAPLLDLCAHAQLGQQHIVDQLGAFGRQLSLRSHEIRFRTELLKRYVSNRGTPCARSDTEAKRPRIAPPVDA